MSRRYYDFTKTVARKATENEPRHSEASIVELNDGTLLMAWQCHRKSAYGSGDQAPSTISLMNSYDCGKTWVNERVVAAMTDGCVNVYSPSFLRASDGSLILFFKRYTRLEKHQQALNSYYRIVSYDEGETWSDEEIIWENSTTGTHNHSVSRLSDGTIIIPLNEGGKWCAAGEDDHYVSVLRTKDESIRDFTVSEKMTVPMRGLMEPCIAECRDGTLNMVMRTQLGSVFYSESRDGGKSWSKPQTTGLKSPESCPCIVSIPNSDAQLVIWNNAEYDMSWYSHYGKRTPLTMAISRDGLKTFSDLFDIETDPDTAFTNPSVTITSDGLFVLNYWSCRYNPDGSFGPLVDLNVATFRIHI